jgi:hypothetical protein
VFRPHMVFCPWEGIVGSVPQFWPHLLPIR